MVGSMYFFDSIPLDPTHSSCSSSKEFSTVDSNYFFPGGP